MDSEGKPIQLSKEHIEFLKTENMLEDEIRNISDFYWTEIGWLCFNPLAFYLNIFYLFL